MSATPTIAFDAARCDGCGDCMKACIRAKSAEGDAAQSRIRIARDDDGGRWGVAQCRQCGDPRCASVCPAAALAKGDDGIVAWDAERCVNCLLCTAGCIYGGIAFSPAEGHVVKCDQCAGAPQCVSACTRGALRYVNAAKLYNRWGELEDLFVPGLGGCQGCNTELIMRHTLRRVGPNTVLATPPGCIPGMGSVGYNGMLGCKVPVFHPLLTNTASMLTGIRRQYRRKGRKVTALALAGDGGAGDVGFQSLSGAAERGEQILFVCVDNEGYMNTGAQRSGSTTYGAWTATTPVGETGRGKTQDAKNLPLLMMWHGCEYVATASTAFMEDFYAKLEAALDASERGFAYLHLYSPCTSGWRFPSASNIEVARKAVETNFALLWEYRRDRGLRLSRDIDHPAPVTEYLELLGKFRHLDAAQTAHIQRHVAAQAQVLRDLAGMHPDDGLSHCCSSIVPQAVRHETGG
ncbi:thiamine pyrophosphate-dependent enzyme [Aromatoleum toluclasticum]|uniref:NADH-dependent phenylglyoxylate dehydrogenase subunit beta n=1 Tax=Aromatoleum toluclasticum TaxID=92003 RepID=UPI001D18D744|nr:thiamine pyrophosphate-dependent enzyme [Aromatoleum toluclasticum]MCC4118275.1 thiamine pyrophosphate-dependent enzyme [Aromatoleum toluclasticum]